MFLVGNLPVREMLAGPGLGAEHGVVNNQVLSLRSWNLF